MMDWAEQLRDAFEQKRRMDFGTLPEAEQNDYLKRAVDRQMPDMTLVGPEQGAILRAMVYGAAA